MTSLAMAALLLLPTQTLPIRKAAPKPAVQEVITSSPIAMGNVTKSFSIYPSGKIGAHLTIEAYASTDDQKELIARSCRRIADVFAQGYVTAFGAVVDQSQSTEWGRWEDATADHDKRFLVHVERGVIEAPSQH